MTNETISDLQTMSGGEKPLLAGRYRPVRQLGQGGMGSVWLAEDTELDDRKVAIKMLPSMLLSNRKSFQQIKSEALVSLKLTHPNIATLRSFEENGGNPFLVIDYIEGQSLDDVLAERGRLDEAETLALLRPVAAAIDYAHREKVVHRDVKPANVMVRADGTPFVLDFGIAREIQETMTRVTGHLSSGTLMYMSPEQLLGKPPSSAQDVYSFAAMAYECLAGTPPFHRGQIEFQILNEPPPPLPSDSAFTQGILRGLAKDPAARPPTCLGVLGEVEPALRRAQPQPPVIRRPVARPAAPAAPRAVRVDADVYLLEDEAKSLLARTVEKYPAAVARELDAELAKAKSLCRAASSALRNGDADAARKLFSQFLDYPAARKAHATRLTLKAFDENRFADAFKCAAEADERDAGVRFLRGYCHQTGEGTPRDLAKARAEYLAAAELGLAAAQFNYASLLHRGEGGDADIPAAVTWYEKAAAKDEADACLALAALYDSGASVPRDAAKAFSLLLKADRLGVPGCAPMLGAFCARNEDAGLSPAARDTYLQAAAAAGNGKAQKILEEKAAREEAERREAERKAEEARREAERLAEESRRAAREAAERRAEEARREAKRRAAEAARLEAERRAAVERWAADRAAVRAKRLADLRRIGAKAVAVLLLTVGLAFGGVQAYRAHRRAEAARQAEAARRAAEAEAKRVAEEKRLAEERQLAEEKRLTAERSLVPQPGDVKEFELPGGAKMKFVWCPPGSFTMGSPTGEEGRCGNETKHRVTLKKGFWLGQFEVTQAQWKAVMGDNPSCSTGDDNRPVERVSWWDCWKFVEKCNTMVKGVRFALPTEAQWEYACRADSTGPYAGTGDLDAMGWYYGNSGYETHPVGRKKPNAWNLYDMHGNVREWCADWYGAYGGDCTDPAGPAWGVFRVLRGGSWSGNACNCRSAGRGAGGPGYRYDSNGFRLLCSAGPHE